MNQKRLINPNAICNYRGPERKTTEHLPPPMARAVRLSKPEPDFDPVISSPLSDVVSVREDRLFFGKGKVGFDIDCFCPLRFTLLTYDSTGPIPYLGADAVFVPDSFAIKNSSGPLLLDPSATVLKVDIDVYGRRGRAVISKTTDFMIWPGIFPLLSYARFYLVANSTSPITKGGVFNFDLSSDPDSKRREAYSRFKDEFFEKCLTAGFSN